MMIPYIEFEKHINDVIKLIRLQDGINSLISNYSATQKQYVEVSFPSLVDNVITLLVRLTNDESNWIPYWVFELDCGEKYKDGCVTYNNENIKLKTIKDLWNLLNMEEQK